MALSGLVPHLPDGLKGKAIQETLRAVPGIREHSLQEDALKAVAPHLPAWGQSRPELSYSVWKETLRAFSTAPRPDFLPRLQMLLPLTMALVGEAEKEKAAAGIVQAVQNVGIWWP